MAKRSESGSSHHLNLTAVVNVFVKNAFTTAYHEQCHHGYIGGIARVVVIVRLSDRTHAGRVGEQLLTARAVPTLTHMLCAAPVFAPHGGDPQLCWLRNVLSNDKHYLVALPHDSVWTTDQKTGGRRPSVRDGRGFAPTNHRCWGT